MEVKPIIWKPIAEVMLKPQNGTQYLARDSDGNKRWTWFEWDVWAYSDWRENMDKEEFEIIACWEPVEYAKNI